MKTPMFSKSHAPLFVGSYLRNTGAGCRISVVTKINKGVVTAITYGHTNKGKFQLAKRHKVITGTLGNCGTNHCSNQCVFHSNTKQGWTYTHVTKGDHMLIVTDISNSGGEYNVIASVPKHHVSGNQLLVPLTPYENWVLESSNPAEWLAKEYHAKVVTHP